MITSIALLKARDGLSRDELIDYYENHHVPLILSLAPAPDYTEFRSRLARPLRGVAPCRSHRPAP
jgi:EthD domain-containing protein